MALKILLLKLSSIIYFLLFCDPDVEKGKRQVARASLQKAKESKTVLE